MTDVVACVCPARFALLQLLLQLMLLMMMRLRCVCIPQLFL